MTSDGSDAADRARDESTAREQSTTPEGQGAPRVSVARVAGSLQVELPDHSPVLDPVAAVLLGAMIQRAVVSVRQDCSRRPQYDHDI
jgi:hypothetical protein